MKTRVLCLLVSIAFTTAAGATGPDKAWRAIGGKALQALITEQDLGDGVHYAYQFHRGGQVTGVSMGKPARGSWKVAGRELCWTWSKPAGHEECYEVRHNGHEIRLFLDGYEAFSGTLTPSEPSPSNEVKP